MSEALNNSFEWNVSRLYSHDPNLSETRNVWVPTLSSILLFPTILTLIVDFGRRLAFSMGLIDGKSWSLIDRASGIFNRSPRAMSRDTAAVHDARPGAEELAQIAARRFLERPIPDEREIDYILIRETLRLQRNGELRPEDVSLFFTEVKTNWQDPQGRLGGPLGAFDSR